jgi:hypothetical protein
MVDDNDLLSEINGNIRIFIGNVTRDETTRHLPRFECSSSSFSSAKISSRYATVNASI